jgi:hypothetical protein
MFTQLKDLIPRTVNKMGLKRQVDAAYICETYRKIAPSVFDDDSLVNCMAPKYFKDGVLCISVENSAYAQIVFMKKHKLIEKINRELRGAGLKEIRTEVNI